MKKKKDGTRPRSEKEREKRSRGGRAASPENSGREKKRKLRRVTKRLRKRE